MSGLSDDDHYVLRKLANEVLPWMAGGALLRRRWFVVLAAIHSYGSELMTAAGALGVGSSVIPAFKGHAPDRFDINQAFSGAWFWPGVICLVLWTVIRIVIAREDILAKAILARDCARDMQKLQQDLDKALEAENPLPAIAPIRETVLRKVGEAIDKGVWKWSPPFPASREIDLELERRIADIRNRLSHHWRDI